MTEPLHQNHLLSQLVLLKRLIFSTDQIAKPEEVCVAISQSLCRHLSTRSNAVWLCQENGGPLLQVAVNGEPNTRSDPIDLWADAGAGFRAALQTGTVHWLEAPARKASGGVPTVLIPLKGGGKVVGLLGVAQPSGDIIDTLQLFAQYGGLMLNNACVYQQIEQQKDELAHMTDLLLTQNAQLTALMHFGLELQGALDPAEVCLCTAEAAVHGLGAKRAATFLVDPQYGYLRGMGQAGDLAGIEGLALPLDADGPVQRCLTTRRLLTSRDHGPVSLGLHTLRTWLSCPFKREQTVFGAVVTELDDFELADPLAICANHASLALSTLYETAEKARLHRTLSAAHRNYG